jgi:hypothetical protein
MFPGRDDPRGFRRIAKAATVLTMPPAEPAKRPATPAPQAQNYLVPFATLKNAINLVSLKGQLKIDLTYDAFLGIVRKLLEAAPVDEAWYRATYPDVAEAIDAGTYRNGKHHFVANGYLEGRRPFPMAVDEAFYLAEYPDVREGIEDGLFASAQEHFSRHGYEEGRRPTITS